MRRPRVDLEEVARVAGVSKSTASRALRGEARVSEATTARVLEIASSLGYVRDLRAAELASSAPTTVGLLIRSADQSFYGEVAAKVQSEADARGIDLLIVSGGDLHDAQERALRNLLGHRVAGIMVASGRASIRAAQGAAEFVPTILLGMDTGTTDIDSVAIDPASETLLASRVIEAGHRNVAVTASDRSESTTLRLRTKRFHDALLSGGATVTVVPGDEESPGFAAALRDALDRGATAVMAGHDPTAVRILELLGDWDLRCPADVSVTGFDGVGVYTSPVFGLATIRQPVEQMAKAATLLMMSRLNGDRTEPQHLAYPGQYVPGRSLSAPRPPGTELPKTSLLEHTQVRS